MVQLAYLGPPTDHGNTLAQLLRDRGGFLTQIPDSVSFGAYRPVSPAGKLSQIVSRVKRAHAQLRGVRDAGYLKQVLTTIDRENISTIIAYWGTQPMPDLVSLKTLRPNLTIALNLLCYPLGLTTRKIAIQDLLFKHSLKHLDGLIVSSTAMEGYVRANILKSGMSLPILKLPPFWHSEYFASVPIPKLKADPNILFLGRTDWKRGQPTDNVGRILHELMIEGVEVYFARSPDTAIRHSNARPFEPLPLSATSNFAAQFDAALITYDLSVASRADRFEVTVPDRLVSSIAAGIPVAIPEGHFAACKEYLAEYDGVLTYKSSRDLAEQLRDRSGIDALRIRARRASHNYHAENHIDKLFDFLTNI